ncbi:MAG: UTRA domain-containing protein [Kiloniellaceae bacterium]
MEAPWTIPEAKLWSIPNEVRTSWDRRVPYYLRIRDHFASLIEAGSLAPGMKLPPERTLGDEFRITRVTVRQALMQLEAEGLIFRETRRGWFVSPPRIRYDPTANASFTESVTEQGRVAGTTVLSTERIAASTWESKNLNCAVGDPIYLIRRLRSVDGRAVLVEHLHVKAERCPGLLEYSLDRSLTELMSEKFGIVERRARINMRPTVLPEPHAQALGVAAGTASLYLSRIIYDQFNEVIEFDQEFWRHDALDIWVEIGEQIDEARKDAPATTEGSRGVRGGRRHGR